MSIPAPTSNRGEAYVGRLRAASRGGYVIGSFNLDLLDVLGQLAARAAKERTPIIFQFGPWSVGRLTITQIGRAARALMADRDGVFLHLDHCSDESFIAQSLDAGFDSVMFDGSGLPLEENIARTRGVVKLGRARGAAVEGAVGQLERGVDTRLEDAGRFVAETGVDALGVAVGTGHGQKRAPHEIDLDRLRALSTLGTPLVIHGGSGLPAEAVREVRQTAVAKINVATALYQRFRERMGELSKGDSPTYPSAVTSLAADAFWEVIRERAALFGCLGTEAAP